VEYSITARNGDSVKIDAENWLAALGKALPFFAIDTKAKMVCTPGVDGSVLVETPDDQNNWMVREVFPVVKVVAGAASERLPSLVPEAEVGEMPATFEAPANVGALPTFEMPLQSSLQRTATPGGDDDDEEEEEESLAERLFDLSFDLTEAKPDQACELGLDLILEFVPAEAGSVARGSLNDAQLTFVAATGPVADGIVGRKVKFGQGLIGMCFDMKGTLLVNDVREDKRHLETLDMQTGFVTKTALCVPILDADNRSFGAIQLLNPPDGTFAAEHIETVETIAQTLAGALSSYYDAGAGS